MVGACSDWSHCHNSLSRCCHTVFKSHIVGASTPVIHSELSSLQVYFQHVSVCSAKTGKLEYIWNPVADKQVDAWASWLMWGLLKLAPKFPMLRFLGKSAVCTLPNRKFNSTVNPALRVFRVTLMFLLSWSSNCIQANCLGKDLLKSLSSPDLPTISWSSTLIKLSYCSVPQIRPPSCISPSLHF